MMSRSFDWLRTTRARLTLMFCGAAILTGLAIGLAADRILSRHLEEISGHSLVNASRPIALALSQGMQEREREVALLAHLPLVSQAHDSSPELQSHLEQIQQSYPYYAWIGMATPQGKVHSATSYLFIGQDVSALPWFHEGLKGPYVGDTHVLTPLDKQLTELDGSAPQRFLDYASPVRRQDSSLSGVVTARVHWSWLKDIINGASPTTDSTVGMEVLLASRVGLLNATRWQEMPPDTLKQLPASGSFSVMTWDDGEEYLTSVVPVPQLTTTDLGWQIVTRQPLDKALAPLNHLHSAMALLLVLSTAMLTALAYWVARRFSVPVEQLARAARQIDATGQVDSLNVPVATLELQQLRDAMRRMTQGLLDSRTALEQANAVLEHRVAQRTQELHQSEQRYLSILEDQTEIICRFDAANRLTFANDAFCRLFHLDRNTVLGQVWAPVVHPDDLAAVEQRLRSITPAQPLINSENRVIAGDGSVRWYHFTNRAMFSANGQLLEWQTVGHDVTERHRLEHDLARASEQFQDLYDNAPCGYYALDKQGRYVHLNNLTLSWLGCTREQVVGKLGPSHFFDEESRAKFAVQFPIFLQTGKIGPIEFTMYSRQGEARRVSVISTAIKDAEGIYVMSRSIMYDVTELHSVRQRLHALNLEQAAMLDNDLIGISKVRDRVIVWRNQALERIFGYASGALQGRGTEEMYLSRADYEAFGQEAYAQLAAGQHVRQERKMRRQNGDEIWVSINGMALGHTGESLWMMQDITAIKQYQEQVEHIAFHDSLTHLPNRLLLADRMKQAFAFCDRAHTMAALCYLDLNGFKPINDQHGHDVGDEVLRVTAQRLLKQVRANDTVARMGGDEFVLLLSSFRDPGEITPVLERVVAAVAQPIDLGDGRTVGVTAAMGTAIYPRDSRTPSDLLRRADEAMYANKTVFTQAHAH